MAVTPESYEQWKKEREIRKAKLILGSPTVDENYIKQYGADVSKFLTDSANNSGNIKWGQSQTALNSFNKQSDEFKYKQILINDWLSKNAQPGSYDELTKSFESVNTGINDLRDVYTNLNTTMSSYDSAPKWYQAVALNKYQDISYAELNDIISKEQDADMLEALNSIKYTKQYKTKADYEAAIADIDKEIAENEAFIKASKSQYTGGGTWDKGSAVPKVDTSAQQKQVKYLKTLRSKLVSNSALAEFTEIPYELGEENVKFVLEQAENGPEFNNFSITGNRYYSAKNPTIKEIEDWSNTEQALKINYDNGIDNGEYNAHLDKRPVINDPLGFVLEHPDLELQYNLNGSVGQVFDDVVVKSINQHWNQINEQEKLIYKYTLVNKGTEKALEYLELLAPELGQRYQDELNGKINDILDKTGFAGSVALSVATIPMSLMNGIGNFISNTGERLKGNEINPYDRNNSFRLISSGIRGEVGEDIANTVKWEIGGHNVLQEAYNIGMSMGDSISGAVLLGPAYSVVAGSNAAIETAEDIYDRGGNANQVFWGSFAAGVAEMALEYFSIEKLLKNAENVVGLKAWAKEMIKQGGIEASEEVATELANMISDGLIMDEKSTFNNRVAELMQNNPGMTLDAAQKKASAENLYNVIWAGVGGFFSGVGSSAIFGGANLSKQNSYNNQVYNNLGLNISKNGNTQDLIEFAKSLDNKAVNKALGKMKSNGQVSNVALGKIAIAVKDSVKETLSSSSDYNDFLSKVESIGATVNSDIARQIFATTAIEVASQHNDWISDIDVADIATKQDSPFAEMKSQIGTDVNEPFIGVNSDIEYTAEQATVMARISDLILNEGRDIYNYSGQAITPTAIGLDTDSELYKQLKSVGLTDSNGNIRGLVFLDEASRREGKVVSNVTASENVDADIQYTDAEIIDSFDISDINDYVYVQKQVINTLKSEGFFTDEGGTSTTVTNGDSGMVVEVTVKSIKETFNGDNYAHVGQKLKFAKLATIRDIPTLIEKGTLVDDDVANTHNTKSSVKYAYIESNVLINGKPATVKIAVRKSPQKNKFWVHTIDIKNDDGSQPAGASEGSITGYQTSVDKKSISQNKGKSQDSSNEIFDFLDDQKVYPEVSAQGPEADWFADEAFKARGLERLTDDQKFIKAVGKALGCEVEFKNLDRWVTDENGKRKRVSPNGRFDKNTGKIYINTSTYTKHDALQFIFKHELTHFAESDIKAYTNFANGVMDSPVFKQWVKSKGYTDSEQVSATMAMNKDYINDYRTSGIKSLEKFDETDANMEMVADFVAENLFSTDLSKLQNALSYVDNETRSKFMQFVLDLLEKLRSVFKGNQSRYMDIDSIEAEFIKVCEAAKEVWEQKQTKSTETAQNKKSTNEGGKSYSLVVASTDILELVQKVKSGNFKANEKVYFENISDGLAAKIQKLTGVNVKNFKVAIEARQVEHILKDHGGNGKSDHSMSSDEDIAKMEYVLKNPDDLSLAGKTQAYSYMKNGYNKTADTVLYEKSIGDKSYYVVQAIPDTKAKTLYVVSAFIGEKGYKKETSQLINAKSPDATAKSGSVVVSNNRIAQNEPSVNNYSMQEVDENTQSAENSDNQVVSADSNSKEKFSFAGERAKTANVKTLDEAKQLEADGVDSETIRKQTGWFKGYDNKWRFEINDHDMKVDLDVVSNACRNFDLIRLWELQNFLRKDLNKEKFNEFCDMLHNLNEAKFKKIMLSDILEHDALFKAYPQLKNIKIEFINLPMHVDGQYDASTNTINVSLELLVVKRKLDTTLIHEIQHAIQEIEEFTTGTNLEFWAYYRYDGRTIALEKRYEEILVKFPKRMQTLIRKIDRALENRDYDVAAEFEETIKNSKYSDLYNQYADVRARQAYAEKIRNDKRNNEQLYFDSAGERESRDVETRLKWSDEERQNNRPDIDYDNTVFVDKEYLKYLETLYNMAIEKGFDEQADKLVGVIAKSNGYNLKLYHQTTSDFNVFDTRHKGAGSVDYETPHGIFLKPDESKIGIKGEKQMPLYTKMNNPLTVDDRDALTQWYRDNVTGYSEAESSIEKIGIGYKVKLEKAEKAVSKYLTDYRKSNSDKPSSAVYDDVKFNELCDAKDRIVDEWGKAYDEQAKKTKELLDDFFKSSEYDGVHIKSDVGSYGRHVETYIAFEPEQVKSADAITYSDNGSKIALSNRFDEESQDIRYSLPRRKVDDLFERYKNGEISEEKFKSLISETPEQNPVSIAKIKKSQVSTTPQVEKNAGENKGGKQSNVYESLKGSDIFDDKFKRDITNDSWVKSYGATTNKETLSKACKALDDGGTGYVERLKFAKPNEVSLIDIAAGLILIDRYQRVGDYEGSIAFAEKVREWGTASGQQVQIFSILGRFNPDSMVTYAQKELDKAFEAMIESKTNRWVQKNKKELKLNAEDIEFIRRRTLQAALLEDGTRQKAILLAEICTRIQDKIPPDSGQAIRALQRMSMLLNIKTNIRNVVGNASMVPVYITSDFFGAGIDKLIAKKTGVRTTGTFKTKGSVKAFGKGLYESYDDFKRGIHTKQEELNRFEVNPQSAKNFNEHHNGVLAKQLNDIAKFLNKMDSFTSFCLEAGDRPFYEMWFNNSLNRQLELNNTDTPTMDMLEIAKTEALQRTWQDDSTLARSVAKIKATCNLAHLPGTSYGLGDMITKFTKTPANISKAIIDFSPLGLISAGTDFYKMSEAIKKGRFTPQMQKKAVRSLSNAIVGTIVYALVGFGAAMGVVKLSGAGDDDKDVSNFEKYIVGIPPYSINVFGHNVTYDWMQPFGSVLAIVAEYSENSKNKSNGFFDDVYNALLTGGNVFCEQSFLQGFQDIFAQDSLIEALLIAAINDPATFIPQWSSQVASFIDDKRRVSYEPTDEFQSSINKIIAKVPGLRQLLPEQVNVLGETVENNQYLNPWKAFAQPWNDYPESSGKVAEEIYQLYKSTGDKTVMPRVAPNSITVKGRKYSFDAKQKTDYQRKLGNNSRDMLEILFESKQYNKLTDEEKAKVIKKIYDYSTKLAKVEVVAYEYDYELLSSMVGKNANGKPILTESMYNKLNSNAKKRIIEEYLLSKNELKFKTSKDAVEYYINQVK